MKRLTSLFFMVLALAGLTANAQSSRWETLRAINWVENPTNQTRYGSKGELGPYQFRRDTWRLHTSKPFSLANDRATADEVAVLHYEWIKQGLVEAGIDPSSFNIAMAWNCGLGAVKAGRVPTVSYQYAEQVRNLAEMFNRRAREEQVAQVAPRQEQPVANDSASTASVVSPRFTIATDSLRLVIPGQQQHFTIGEVHPESAPVADQVVKITVLDPEPVPAINLSIEKPLFTFTTASAPRIALID